MIVILKEYNGKFQEVRNLYENIGKMVENSEKTIYNKLGLPPPPNDVVITLSLIDTYGIPMVSPTGFTSGFTWKKKNIKLSAPAVANDFWGLTSTQKVLTHELVHAYFMYYGGENYTYKPLWMKEGIALWTADQTYDKDFTKVPIQIRNGRWADYLSYLTRFEDALQKEDGNVNNLVKYLIE